MPYQVGVNVLGTKAYHLAHSKVIVAIIIEESSTISLDERMCEFLYLACQLSVFFTAN